MPLDEPLTLDEVKARADEIRAEMERLLGLRGFASRPNARQWKFLRHCLDSLLSGRSADFDVGKAKATQYRFEVEDRLNRFYAKNGPPVKLAFSLRHASHAGRDGSLYEYPESNGYVLLVSDVKGAYQFTPARETRALLERKVADAAEAEFDVYRALPKIDLTPLSGVYREDGSAYRRIREIAEKHHAREWTLLNHNNPSTRRLVAVKSIELKGTEAWVKTREYWYLRWWCMKRRKYTYIYNQEDNQTYVFERDGDTWLVVDSIYPPPRASASRRKWY